MSALLSLVFGLQLFVVCWGQSCFHIEIEPDSYPEDISWSVEKSIDQSGIAVESDSGLLINNNRVSNCIIGLESDCFKVVVNDSYGDGFCCNSGTGNGKIDIYWKGSKVDSFPGRIYSDTFLESGSGGESASEIFFFENGTYVPYCTYGGAIPSYLCNSYVDIELIIIFDESFDLSHDWYNEADFAERLLEHYVPQANTRVGVITFGSEINIKLNLTSDLDFAINVIKNLEFNGGSHKTEKALTSGIDMLLNSGSNNVNTQQFILIITSDEVDSNQDPCSLESYLDDNGIELIVVSESDLLDGIDNPLLCLMSDFSAMIEMESFDSIDDYIGNVELHICPINVEFRINEVMVDDSNSNYWVEIYNYGPSFNLNNLDFVGLFNGNPNDNTIVNQGDFILLYSNENPCPLCGISSSIPFGSGDNSSWSISISYNSSIIDSVTYNSNTFPIVHPQFSYELTNKYYNNNDGSNWRESCLRNGSAGYENSITCPVVCDVLKCQINGDDGASCSSPNDTCNCSSNYYYDDITRSCNEIAIVSSCIATVKSGLGNPKDLLVTWDLVSDTSFYLVNGYKFSDEFDDMVEYVNSNNPLFPYALQLDNAPQASLRISVNVSLIQDSSTKLSSYLTCDYLTLNPTKDGDTLSPSITPTLSPVTTVPPTKTPTRSPTFAGCATGLKLDLVWLLDSSGSLYDSQYNNWFAELNFAKNVVNKSIPEDSRVGLINFSGCSGGDLNSCLGNRIIVEWVLTTYSNNDEVWDAIDELDGSDFTRGYTWIDDALFLAKDQFDSYGDSSRQQMIILVTDGKPTAGHEPCTQTYQSSTLQALKNAGVTIVAVAVGISQSNIGEFFDCVVTDPEYIFTVNDFDDLSNSSLIDAIQNIVCSGNIELIINEVMVEKNFRFVEIYNPSIGVSLKSFYLKGLFDGTFDSQSIGIDNNQYWVMSDYNMTGNCPVSNCSHDYFASDFTVDTSMRRTYWNLSLYAGDGTLLDFVEYNPLYFPRIDENYTCELILETFDNTLGQNWEESCYEYGTPQRPNWEPCPCFSSKCRERNDTFAYCSADGTTCICSNGYIPIGGVCVPIFPPLCCDAWEIDINNFEVRVTWCSPPTSNNVGYIVYFDGVPVATIASTVRFYDGIVPSWNVNISVVSIASSNPQVLSDPVYCPIQEPTIAPTNNPTIPAEPSTAPTKRPSEEPTPPSVSPTFEPSNNPSFIPTLNPSYAPTHIPSLTPTALPTGSPLVTPEPTMTPSKTPSEQPTSLSVSPTDTPSYNPTHMPSTHPTDFPTISVSPTQSPTDAPTNPITPRINITGCIFEDNGAAILMTFDRDTNRANLGGSPFSCLLIFTPPTLDLIDGNPNLDGESSRCIWKSFDTLRIELGYGFSVRPDVGDYLELIGNNILNYDENGPTAKGICHVTRPHHHPTPVAKISGPQIINDCDDLFLSAEVSYGLGGINDAVDYFWTILPPISGTLENKRTLNISSSQLNGGTIYIVGLTVRNYYLEQDSTSIYVEVTSNEVPYVVTNGPNIVDIYTSEALELSIRELKSSCKLNSEIDLEEYTFKWTQVTDLFSYDPFPNFVNDFPSVSDTNIISSLDTSKSSLYIPANTLTTGDNYLFNLSVSHSALSEVSITFIGVRVLRFTPIQKPSKEISIYSNSDYNITLNELFFFELGDNEYLSYNPVWACDFIHYNNNITNRDCIVDLLNIGNSDDSFYQNINGLNDYSGKYNISVKIARNGEFISSNFIIINVVNNSNFININYDVDSGIVNNNNRFVISSYGNDYSDSVLSLNDYTYNFEWIVNSENIDLNSYGISNLNGYFVIDNQLGEQFTYDGEKYELTFVSTLQEELDNGSVNTDVSGYSSIFFYGNRGPNGGICQVETVNSNNEFEVSCYGFTDEIEDLPLKYNWMLLDECESGSNDDCKGELICDINNGYVCVTQSGVIGSSSYMTEWSMSNRLKFNIIIGPNEKRNSTILRSFIRDRIGYITVFDVKIELEDIKTSLSVSEDYVNDRVNDADISVTSNNDFNEFLIDVNEVNIALNSMFLSVFDSFKAGDERYDLFTSLLTLYNNNNNNLNIDRFEIFSQLFGTIFFEDSDFKDNSFTDSNVVTDTISIITSIRETYETQSNNSQLERNLATWMLMSLAWSGNALRSYDLSRAAYRNSYMDEITSIALDLLKDKKVDETPVNISLSDISIIASYESEDLLYTDVSSCGGDNVDLPHEFTNLFVSGNNNFDYVECRLITYNGSLMHPDDLQSSTPFVDFTMNGINDNSIIIKNIDNSRRRRRRRSRMRRRRNLLQNDLSNSCSPILYTISHNNLNENTSDTGLLDYNDRIDATKNKKTVPFTQCYSYDSSTGNVSNTDACYVATHDVEKTVCACNAGVSTVSMRLINHKPTFYADLTRNNPPFTYDGLLQSVCALLWFLILAFVFTFALYMLPTYDKHKALLAVKKGLPKSERLNAHLETGDGKQLYYLKYCEESFYATFNELYKIRLRNDHLCLWWCCDDPGSNISHYMKLLLTLMYCLLFMTLLAWFYAKEHETRFPGSLYAFLIAFLTIIPVWLLSWCISKIRPHEFTDDEIEEIIEDRMPNDTRNDDWEEEYSSEEEQLPNKEWEFENEGLFAPPPVLSGGDVENNSKDVKRIFTNIDEEYEFLEDNFMPNDGNWFEKKEFVYAREKFYKNSNNKYDNDYREDSLSESYEGRLGFKNLKHKSHKSFAEKAEYLGYIDYEKDNDDDEEDVLDARIVPNPSGKKPIYRRERKNETNRKKPKNFLAGDYSSSEEDDNDYSEEHEEDKPTIQMNAPTPMKRESQMGLLQNDNKNEKSRRNRHKSSKKRSKSNNRKKNKNKNKNKNKHRSKNKNGNKNNSNKNEIELTNKNEIIKLKKKPKDVSKEDEIFAIDLIKQSLKSNRNRNQFIRILALGQIHRRQIVNGERFRKIIDGYVFDENESLLLDSNKLVNRAEKLIHSSHKLFKPNEEREEHLEKLLRRKEITDEVWKKFNKNDKKHVSSLNNSLISKLRTIRDIPELAPCKRDHYERKTNIGDNVYNNNTTTKINETLSKLENKNPRRENLYEKEKELLLLKEKNKTRNNELNGEYYYDYSESEDIDKIDNNSMSGSGVGGDYGLNLDDIWDQTGALPINLLKKLEDAFDAWEEEDIKPIQKPITNAEERDYKSKMRHHFRKRRELLQRKYCLPRYCRYICWFIILFLIGLLCYFFLKYGNMLGAKFLHNPFPHYDTTLCSISIPETDRFDYDYSIVEAKRRNPANSPPEYKGSMPNHWDYRVRFSIAAIFTFFTSIFIVQPFYIFLIVIFIMICFPFCMPWIAYCRNNLCCCLCWKKDKNTEKSYKEFIGGQLLINNDTILDYKKIDDSQTNEISQTNLTENSTTNTYNTINNSSYNTIPTNTYNTITNTNNNNNIVVSNDDDDESESLRFGNY